MAGTFEIKSASNGRFMFNLKAGNGQVILTSQTYAALQSARDGVESVRRNAALPERFEKRTATDSSPYFVLWASNGQEIGRSQMYSSEAARDNGIASVQNHAADARLVETLD
jgi:uncharacterized protein YegP (UPF0339 family)